MTNQPGPVTDKEIEEEFERATEQELQWLAQQEEVFDDLPMNVFNDSEPLGLTFSRLNPHGIFTPDGRKMGSTCGCEDYPCCGH